jgi:hypothetical protein
MATPEGNAIVGGAMTGAGMLELAGGVGAMVGMSSMAALGPAGAALGVGLAFGNWLTARLDQATKDPDMCNGSGQYYENPDHTPAEHQKYVEFDKQQKACIAEKERAERDRKHQEEEKAKAEKEQAVKDYCEKNNYPASQRDVCPLP